MERIAKKLGISPRCLAFLEYVLIVALLSIVAITSLSLVGGTVGSAFEEADKPFRKAASLP